MNATFRARSDRARLTVVRGGAGRPPRRPIADRQALVRMMLRKLRQAESR
jgi:hypothetical protein